MCVCVCILWKITIMLLLVRLWVMADKDLNTHFLATFLFVFIRYWQRGIIYIGDYSVYALHYKMFYFIILLYKSPLNVSLHKRFV